MREREREREIVNYPKNTFRGQPPWPEGVESGRERVSERAKAKER